jgi:hypothetical protein
MVHPLLALVMTTTDDLFCIRRTPFLPKKSPQTAGFIHFLVTLGH